MIVSLCTNDEHGNDTGRVSAVEVGNDGIDLQWSHFGSGPRYSIKNRTLQISRRKFPIIASRDWYGNWCWTGVEMTVEAACDLLNYLRKDERWHCEGGLCELCDAYEAGKVTIKQLIVSEEE